MVPAVAGRAMFRRVVTLATCVLFAVVTRLLTSLAQLLSSVRVRVRWVCLRWLGWGVGRLGGWL